MANRSLFRNRHLSHRSSGVGVQEWRGVAEGDGLSPSPAAEASLSPYQTSLGRACPCTGGSCKTQCGKTCIITPLGVVWNALPSSRLPRVVQGTGDIRCYGRQYWVVSPDVLVGSFEAADGEFLLNPSQRQIAIRERHPRVRCGPDPKVAD